MLTLNRPGTLRRAEPFDVQTHDGFSIETAFLEFEDRFGRPVRLYAARCVPSSSAKLPLVVHQPGGGQTVSPADLVFLARQGFAAASFDWQIGAFDHDPKRKSRWPEGVCNQNAAIEHVEQAILPLAIQACGVVIDWMAQHPGVDASRVGVAGISWGGYLTWAVNAHEPRLKAAAPVFGCGGLWEFGRPLHTQAKGKALAAWQSSWDALALAARQISPVCWVSSTNDFFGFHSAANALLNQLRVPHRRSCDPNNNHHVGAGESVLVVAWLKHYLAGGPAVPREPVLRDDLTIDAQDSKEDPIVEKQLWWSPPADVPDDYRCWLQSEPLGQRVERALGRVRYRSGLTLDTPLRSFVASPAAAGAPAELPDTWPDARDGTCSHWGLRSTQLHRTDVSVSAIPGDPTRSQWRVDRKDAGAVAVSFRGVADPRWNRGSGSLKVDAIELNFDWQGANATALSIVGEFVMPDGRRAVATQAVTVDPAATGAKLLVRLDELKGRPAGATWADLKKLIVTGHITGNRFIMGPMVRVRA